MRKIRSALAPIALFVPLTFIASLSPDIGAIAEFAFFWDVTAGVLLGAGIAVLPALSGRRDAGDKHLVFFWICGFCALVIIFVQYMDSVVGLQSVFIALITPANTRVRVMEGAILGYCSLVAAREKL